MVSYKTQPYTPYVTFGDTSPYTGEARPCRFLRMEFERAGHATAPTNEIEGASHILSQGGPLWAKF